MFYVRSLYIKETQKYIGLPSFPESFSLPHPSSPLPLSGVPVMRLLTEPSSLSHQRISKRTYLHRDARPFLIGTSNHIWRLKSDKNRVRSWKTELALVFGGEWRVGLNVDTPNACTSRQAICRLHAAFTPTHKLESLTVAPKRSVRSLPELKINVFKDKDRLGVERQAQVHR